jgi:hypothetical protein
MATRGDEMEVLGRGIKAASLAKGGFVQNMYRRKGAWEARAGFGQIGQFDTTMARENTDNPDNAYGYRDILGSASIATNFGSVQVVTLLAGFMWTGNIETRGRNAKVYALSIFDVTTGARWEEILHAHTGENDAETSPMPLWHGTFETNRTRDYGAFPSPPYELAEQNDWTLNLTDDRGTFFREFQDTLLFGNQDMGLWAYVPADFTGTRPQQIDGARVLDTQRPYSESSRCFRVVPGAGPFIDKYDYLPSAGFPSPVDAAVFLNGLAIADKRTVYFTDAGYPGSIIAGNSIDVPGQTEITALAECNGNLLIWTTGETFLFQPGDAVFVASGARMQAISTAIGCAAPALHTRMGNAVVWVDQNGVHRSTGQLDIETLSDDIEPFFEEGVSNPLTDYYRASGNITLPDQVRPATFLSFADSRGANLCYYAKDDLLLLSVPTRNGAMVMQGKDWSWWSFSTLTRTTEPTLGNLHLSAVEADLFAVGGVVATAIAAFGGESTSTTSHYVLRWGDGGAIDRSAEVASDQRGLIGYYTEVGDQADLPVFILDKPVLLPEGYRTAYGALNTAAGREVWAYPLYLSLGGTVMDVSEIVLEFDFSTFLKGVSTGGNAGQMAAMVPPQRVKSRDGWGMAGVPAAGRQICMYALGVPDDLGTTLKCNFTGLAAPAWDLAPALSIGHDEESPLLYLLFKDATISTTSLDISAVTATVGNGIAAPVNARLIWWHQPILQYRRTTVDENAQCIDYAYKSEPLETGKGDQIKARGLFLRMLSHGKGGSFVGATTHGQLNAVVGSDGKDWTSQIIDQTDDLQLDNDKTPIRSRFRGLTSTAAITQRVFNSTATDYPRWGSGTDATKGNFLIDDEQVDTIAISDSVRGETVTWMVFGHLRNRAERIVLDSIKAVLRVVGGRRRIGR